MRSSAEVVDAVEVAAYRMPTDAPESDGTLAWDSTTMVVVHAHAGGRVGLGYTYAPPAAARVVRDTLAGVVQGRDARAAPAAWQAMVRAVRNQGRAGIAGMAISAVDCALWDLHARLLDAPLIELLGAYREQVPVYGSGGFTSYPESRLCDQLAGWVERGIGAVKMKVGRVPSADAGRVRAARSAIGPEARLFVDANGAYTLGDALRLARVFAAEADVRWFEEPRPSDDLDGLRRVRDRAPGGMDVAAGEYGWHLWGFRALLAAGAVDCLQADVTRCGGITGFRRVAALADGFQVPVSAHCAPQQSAHVCCAVRAARHIEYFHDHARVERALLDGALEPVDGRLAPDRGCPGHGLTLKRRDAEPFRIR